MSEWVQLKRGNDWGRVYLSRVPLGRDGCASTKRAINVRRGDVVRVKWPDGKETEERISMKLYRLADSVFDHGHDEHFSYELPGFDATLHGVPVWVALDEVLVDERQFPIPKEDR